MGFTGPILLVPELCYVTGISDEMRSDFRVMKDLANHTQLAPSQRRKTLQNLIDQINRSFCIAAFNIVLTCLHYNLPSMLPSQY